MFKTKDSTLNFFYSIGAAIVILGALFKLTHIQFLFINGNTALSIGLVMEAIIFVIYAFDTPKEEKNYAWENVYPQLLDKEKKPVVQKNENQISTKELEVSLSQKLDSMLKEAKLDAQLFETLKTGIDKFSASVSQINSTLDVSATTAKYNQELEQASKHMQSLNSLYQLQYEHNKAVGDISKVYVDGLSKTADNTSKLNEELEGVTSNLSNLNKVYGGMLSAMKG